MSNNPDNLKYTKTHEWVRKNGELIEVGITDFAQHQLSDVTFVDLPDVNEHFEAGEEAAVVESIKAASDIYAPVAGTVTEVNEALADTPGSVNSSPFEAGWLFRMKPDNAKDLDALMGADAYEASLPAEH